ncbi:alpha/beta hydrolase [Streptomyces sp. A3M-1-3]|uniref:alpha/beta hydrolase n=1 Tax=Streptomyces sp. A3M-1-3 TaxID=2962044 RepID=UPI0020B7241F|nr:alpha/beta hydrolase [Streptomyces sp. A3M-1-3]MCP3818485.1 alpha/beta hydrolase [Streptomyces sp. A3M-1-3]
MTQSLPAELDLGWPPPPFLAPVPPVVTEDGVRRFEGVTYATTPGYRPRLLDVHVPAGGGPFPVVVWIHGGGWLEGDRRYPPPTIPVDLLHGSVLRSGLALVCVDYRHSLEAPFPAQLHDVKAAIRYLRRYADTFGIDTDRIGVWGESAGGHLAALAGLVRPDGPDGVALEGIEGVVEEDSAVQAVVDWYGVSEVASLHAQPFPPPSPSGMLPPPPSGMEFPNPYTALLGGTAEEHPALAAVASPVTYAGGETPPPFLLVHGTQDGLVPYSQSEVLAEALKSAGGDVTLQPVDGADHIFLGVADVTPIVTDSAAFLARQLSV